MSDKLRLDYFLSVGGRLAEGDVYTNINGVSITVSRSNLDSQNLPVSTDNKRFIKSFAPRKNEGVMPCDGDLPIAVEVVMGGLISKRFANSFNWSIGEADVCDIEFWRPNLSDLIGMQKEHDAKLVENKQKTIMDALNWFKGEVPTLVGAGGVLVECIRMHYGCPLDVVGGIYAGGGGFDDRHFRQICTKEEYEALVEELSRPEKEEPKIYTQAMADAGERPVVGVDCIVVNCGNESAGEILFISGQYCIQKQGNFEQHYHTNGLSFKPIDNRTEKEKVIDGITDLVNRAVNEGECTNVVVEAICDKLIAKK